MTAEQKREMTFEKLSGLKGLGSIPKIVFEVNQILKTEPDNILMLANAICKDPGLTIKLLSIANSPLYGLQGKVSSIEFALMLMGTEEVVQIVTAISILEAFKFRSSAHFNSLDYWKHSMITGTAAKNISRQLGFQEISGEAFLVGMLHDFGMLVIAKYFSTEYEILLMKAKAGISFLAAEKEVLGANHQEIGNFLLRRWELPESIAEAIGCHHFPSQSQNHRTLCSIVHLVDCMTREFRVGNMHWDNDIDFDTSIIEALGFNSAEELASFITDYKDIFSEVANSIKL